MIHECSICGRHHECGLGVDCDRPEKFPMNCGNNIGHPIHQEEYLKAIGVKK